MKPEDVVAQTKDTFLGDGFVKEMLRVCAAWPKGTLPPGYADPVRSDVPVLLLSGELDPVTPPRHAEAAKATLSRSVHLVVPGVGHGASYLGCMPRLIAEFVERANRRRARGLVPAVAEAAAVRRLVRGDHAMIEVERLQKSFGAGEGGEGGQLRRPRRGDHRAARPERRREDDHPADAGDTLISPDGGTARVDGAEVDPRAARGAAAARRAPRRARALPAADRARAPALLRASCTGSPERRSSSGSTSSPSCSR